MKIDSYAGKVVLITGAASGFGARLAQVLGASGARLVLGDVDMAGLESVVAALRHSGVAVVARHCDVRQEAQAQALVRVAVEQFDTLDVAVNNAGIVSPMKALIDTEEADLDQNFSVNVKGVFFGIKHQIRQMLSQGDGGAILNVASLAGLGGAPKLAAYAAAKHAVVGLTKTAALEYARHGIRVNAVCPFYSTTPMVTHSELADRQAFLASGSPMKRLGTPDETVAVMVMLCAPENSYLTGQAIAVDGGISAF